MKSSDSLLSRAPGSDGAAEIGAKVFWVGAFDPALRTFDLMLKTERGTTYNAYVVRGRKSVAVIDTVKAGMSEEFFRRIESVASYDEISAVVVNHLEPDHSGALPELLRRAPRARLYVSARGKPMLKGLLNIDSQRLSCVNTGDSIDLGGRVLSFLNTPYLHWPDTQCTWLGDAGILFSGDIFGSHYCDPRLFNDAVGDFHPSFEYYFKHLMRPFRSYVREALELIEPLPLTAIAPAHGPVLRSMPRYYVRRYRELATPAETTAPGEKCLRVFYLSVYGSTRAMAEVLAAGAESAGGVKVSLHDLERHTVDEVLDLIEECDGVALGCPTMNGDVPKLLWNVLSSLTDVDVRGKLGAAFGSFGWSGEAVAVIEDRLRSLRFRVPQAGVRARLVPTPDELALSREFGIDLAKQLTGRAEKRIVDMASLA